jgi:cytochrome o ubiquinol oxidase subunit 3
MSGIASVDRQSPPRLFGFWIFLMSDALIFALLFAIYATQLHATDGGPTGHELFDIRSTSLQTAVLLASSFTFAMATLNLQYRPQQPCYLVVWVVLSLALGILFMGLELHDFSAMLDKGAPPQRSGYLSALYTLVSTHGLHVAAGSLWLALLLVQIKVFGVDAIVKRRVQCLALFWHFLDIIWVAIYAVVYLQGLTG